MKLKIKFAAAVMLVSALALVAPDPVSVAALEDSEYQVQIVEQYGSITEFLDIYAETENFLSPDGLSVGETQELALKGEQVCIGCTTGYERIDAIAGYIAENTYYDYEYLAGIRYRSQEPFDVYKSNIAVCLGFANLTTAMMRACKIPCVTAISDSHAFNFAYDGWDWIFIDTTWACRNKLTETGELVRGKVNEEFFDMLSEGIYSLGEGHRQAYFNFDGGKQVYRFKDDTAVILRKSANM